MILITVLIFAAVVCTGNGEWHEVWEDNFDGNTLNLDNWKYQVGADRIWGHNELEYYTENKTENVRVENGHLVIEAYVENMGGKNFTSGRLNSIMSWTRGKFEIMASLPKGKHLWPAIWMLPDEKTYGIHPASGEIDIMESRGQKSDTVLATLHYGGAKSNNVQKGSPETKFSDLSVGFHMFTLEWDEKEMRWIVDGKVYFKVSNLDKMLWSGKGHNPYTKPGQPFDKPFHLLLNVAVGGTFFSEEEYGKQVTPEEAKHWAKPRMEIDYIRVYQWK